MNTLPWKPKIIGILLIFLLLGSFVFGAAAEIVPQYINLLLPIAILVIIAFGIIFYYNNKRKRLTRTY